MKGKEEPKMTLECLGRQRKGAGCPLAWRKVAEVHEVSHEKSDVGMLNNSMAGAVSHGQNSRPLMVCLMTVTLLVYRWRFSKSSPQERSKKRTEQRRSSGQPLISRHSTLVFAEAGRA